MRFENAGIGCLILTVSAVAFGLARAQDVDANVDAAASDGVAKGEEVCFSLRQARSMSALDDHHVYLETSANRNYLLSASTVCPGLRGALGIAVRSREGDRVCGGGLASVTYRPNSAAPATSCTINSIVSVTDKAEAEAIVQAQ